ncbi:MAG: GAF domain-containing protein [Acidobacteria bacterium]|nr:GAF domain-containing protein [Acidobacteriota bacterium]
MAPRILATPDLADRVPPEAVTVRPGGPVDGAVVVTSAAALVAWSEAAATDAVWIVVGEASGDAGFRPFLQLPGTAPAAAVQSAVEAATENLLLRQRLAELERDRAIANERQLDLARVGIALTAEHDLDRLLRLILTTAREAVGADAGSLYLIEESDGSRRLRFVHAQNDSVPAQLASSTMPLDPGSLAGYVALTGEPVTVEDAHCLTADLPYHLNLAFDQATGYYTRSVLTAPMATRAGDVIGVLQLINRKIDPAARILDAATADAAVRPFGAAEVAVLRALAAQAAVALENSRLVQEIERLFEGFVRASVTAIEQRDPSTSGHSLRVAHYTTSLARAVEQSPLPAFAGLRFSRDDLTQLRYAALLHDFGKVGVRESVLTKGRKLVPERLALVQERFRHALRAREAALLRQVLHTLVTTGRAATSEDLSRVAVAMDEVLRSLDQNLAAVLIANEPSVLESATSHLLSQVAQDRFPAEDDGELPYLLPEELRALSVPKGSLDEEERREMESHVVHSYQFLLTLPWPKRYARVPSLAYGHHEKLNGRGYPNRLVAEQIPPEVRMMTVSDIYDALAAADRPYKRAVSPERALSILEDEAKRGFLDADLVRVFIDAKVFARPIADPLAV